MLIFLIQHVTHVVGELTPLRPEPRFTPIGIAITDHAHFQRILHYILSNHLYISTNTLDATMSHEDLQAVLEKYFPNAPEDQATVLALIKETHHD